MAVFERKPHLFARRRATERRIHPRVSVTFPLTLEVGGDAEGAGISGSIEGVTLDLGLGGVRAKVGRYLPLFSRLQVAMALPVTDRDGTVRTEKIASTIAVVRISPEEEGPEGTEYVVALAFTRSTPEHERVMGTFLLQTLLFDPEAELI